MKFLKYMAFCILSILLILPLVSAMGWGSPLYFLKLAGGTLTGNLNMSNNNVTNADWFFGKLNWSWLQNVPSYVPYAGATANLNMGLWNVTATNLNGILTWTDLATYPTACTDYQVGVGDVLTCGTWSSANDKITLNCNNITGSSGALCSNQTASANTYADSLLITTVYNASTVQAVTGTPQGALANIQTYDGISYNVSEASSDMELIVNFTGITEFNQIIVRYKSATTESHTMDIALWDSVLNGWESYRTVGVSPDYNIMTMNVYDMSDHIVDGVVQVRFYTNNVGSSTHKHQFDWVAISKGPATPSSSETDPYSVHVDGNTPLTGNWDAGLFNITANWFNGLFNWSSANNWQTFDGSILTFNETQLNKTIASEGVRIGFNSTYNETYAIWAYNQTYSGSTYNATYDAKNSSQWIVSGNDIYNRNSGLVGIGKSPVSFLDVLALAGTDYTVFPSQNINLTAGRGLNTVSPEPAGGGGNIYISAGNAGQADGGDLGDYGGSVFIKTGSGFISNGLVYLLGNTNISGTLNAGVITQSGVTLSNTYAEKTWGYNQTTPAIADINSRFWNRTQSYNKTEIDSFNATWSSTYNSTYDATTNAWNGNASMVYNHTITANATIFNTYNTIWSSTYNATYDSGIPYWYNHTQAVYDADKYVLNTGDTMTGNLNINANLTVNTTTLHVDSNNGRVGIGTTNPASPLDVVLGTDVPMYLRRENNDYQNFQFSLSSAGGFIDFGGTYSANKAMIFRNMGTEANAEMRFYTKDTQRVVIKNGGNVGIGTAVPTHILNIVGTSNFTDNLLGEKNITAGGYFIGKLGWADLTDYASACTDYQVGVGDVLTCGTWDAANNKITIQGENITGGTINFARLPALTNTHTLDWANITNKILNNALTLSGENITAGTINFARLPSLINTHTHALNNLTAGNMTVNLNMANYNITYANATAPVWKIYVNGSNALITEYIG